MILFLGCSLTFGQGLQIEKWITDGKSIEFCNRNSAPHYNAEQLTYEDDLFRKSKSYPNLVSKELGVSYSTKWGNGGSNDNIVFIIENLQKLIYTQNIDLVVIQFTDVCRDDMFHYISQNNLYDLIDIHIKNQISKIDSILTGTIFDKEPTNIPWIGICWHKEHSSFMRKRYEKNFVPIFYKDEEFNDISTLNQYVKDKVEKVNWPKENAFELCDKYDGVKDGHPTIEWHKVIADSIIRKIKKENIEFKRYNN